MRAFRAGRYIARVRPIYGRGSLAGGVSTARPIRSRSSSAAELRTVVLHSTSARSQGERAYLLIRDQIVTLQLAPGSVIEEDKLPPELGLGRTPIREALQRLAPEKLVSFVPHRGTFVCDINLTDLHRLTEVRTEMEGYAARLAAERATARDRAQMQALVGELSAIDQADIHNLMRLDQRIHRLVYQATRNAFLQAMLEER